MGSPAETYQHQVRCYSQRPRQGKESRLSVWSKNIDRNLIRLDENTLLLWVIDCITFILEYDKLCSDKGAKKRLRYMYCGNGLFFHVGTLNSKTPHTACVCFHSAVSTSTQPTALL